MSVFEILTSERHLGDVIGALRARNGQVRWQERRGADLWISGEIPDDELDQVAADVSAASDGEASCSFPPRPASG